MINPAASRDALNFIIDAWDHFTGEKLPVDDVNGAFDHLCRVHTQAVAIMMIIAETKKRTIDEEYKSTVAIIEKAFGGKSSE